MDLEVVDEGGVEAGIVGIEPVDSVKPAADLIVQASSAQSPCARYADLDSCVRYHGAHSVVRDLHDHRFDRRDRHGHHAGSDGRMHLCLFLDHLFHDPGLHVLCLCRAQTRRTEPLVAHR